MSTVEAAASLFGSDGDSGPDPFAVIGNEAIDTTPPHDEHQAHTSSHPSQMGQESSSWFVEQMYPDPHQGQHDTWFIPTAQDALSSQSHHPGGRPSYDHQQGYHPGTTPDEPRSRYAPSPVTSIPYQSTPASYEPYTPTPPVPYQPYSTGQCPAQQSSYDPYKPTTSTSTSNPYTPRQPTKQLSTASAQPQTVQHADSYNHVVPTVPSPYTASLIASQQQLPNGSPSQASKLPSAPSAAEFRPKASNAYDPPLPPPKVNRTTSPSLLRFAGPTQSTVTHVSHPPLQDHKSPNAYDPPLPPPKVNRTTSPSSLRFVSNPQGTVSHVLHHSTPQDHKSVPGPSRAMSPSSTRSPSISSDSFVPPKTVSAHTSQLRGRSTSNGSTLPSHSVPDPHQPRKEYGLGFGPHIAEPSSYGGQSRRSVEQDIHVSRTRPPYAPSPSLLGTNDPLGRTSSRAPVISFGFGGKVLTCFHNSVDLNTGFDVALSSRRTTTVKIHVLHHLLPDYVSETKTVEYPGPLFSDPGTPVTSLVRAGTSQVKSRKARVMKYLEERAEEIQRGTMYISDNVERQRLEEKLVLVQLLKIMVENDGLLSGSPTIEKAVRTALLPRIAGTMDEFGRDGRLGLTGSALTSTSNAYGAISTPSHGKEAPITVSTLLPSSLDKIQEFLVRGERREAYHYALDQRLWAHAMIIASSLDKEAWKEVVNEFLKAELGIHETPRRATPHLHGKNGISQQTNGREWLRVTYSVFSGQGPNAVQELVPPNLLSRTTTGLPVPAPLIPHVTPLSPNFPPVAVAAQIPAESLSKWPDIVASIISGSPNLEYSATLSALGDYLASHHLVEGAHVCYLLSPQTSVMGGLGSPGTRLVLLGSQNPHINPIFFRDPDPIIFTEIAEFALSLKATTKGQEPFHGFPHLQAYKFIRATYLADIGHLQSATRYCEAITAIMGRPSPYFTLPLVEGLKQLADRLLGSPQMDKSTSWISGKVNKPSLDSIGSWLEVRLTKFIAGDGSEVSPPASELSKTQYVGPFSSYSSISSTTTSASPSPPPTVINSHVPSAVQPPRRSGSAMALPSTTMHAPVDRASSAMEYYRPTRHASPIPPKTAPLHSTRYHYSPHATQTSAPSVTNGYVAAYGSEPSSRKTSLEMMIEPVSEERDGLQDRQEQHEDEQEPTTVDSDQGSGDSGGWWNSLSNTESSSTPTAANFHHVENVKELGEGFISLMDDPALSVTPSAATPSPPKVENTYDEEADDLGLGNNTHKRSTQDEPTKNTEDKSSSMPVRDAATSEEKQDPSPPAATSASSWLSRLWKRSDTPAPIKASLGEETTFYYDKELKRWVNKKAGAETSQPSAPLPPPSRAQTASPSVSNSRLNGMPNGSAIPPRPPPPRTASAIDLSTPPTSRAPRSDLVPTEVASMPNTPAPSSLPNPPPMGRSRSQAAKKNVRSRYVDVFQQEVS